MRRLRLLILAVADRCDQRCLHCQIWMGPRNGRTSLTLSERLVVVDEALAAGCREALLTGGEPLLSSDLWPIAERLRAGGVRLMLATNGMLLDAHAAKVTALFHEVYVSLDGASPLTHDGLRGVPALERVRAGVAALKRCSDSMKIIARSTLHAGNLAEIEAIAVVARGMGFDHVSFLPIDASSDAFGGAPQTRRALIPTAGQIETFEATIARMAAAGACRDGFVLESPAKLRRLARHLRASGAAAPFEAPECDAPWWSSVVEADGSVRPCFFHAPVGDVREGLLGLRAGDRYQKALAAIRRPNDTCARCVCPKKRETSWLRRLTA